MNVMPGFPNPITGSEFKAVSRKQYSPNQYFHLLFYIHYCGLQSMWMHFCHFVHLKHKKGFVNVQLMNESRVNVVGFASVKSSIKAQLLSTNVNIPRLSMQVLLCFMTTSS